MDDTTRGLLAQIQRMANELATLTRERDYWRAEAEINASALDHAIAEIRRLNTPIAKSRALAIPW